MSILTDISRHFHLNTAPHEHGPLASSLSHAPGIVAYNPPHPPQNLERLCCLLPIPNNLMSHGLSLYSYNIIPSTLLSSLSVSVYDPGNGLPGACPSSSESPLQLSLHPFAWLVFPKRNWMGERTKTGLVMPALLQCPGLPGFPKAPRSFSLCEEVWCHPEATLLMRSRTPSAAQKESMCLHCVQR